MLELDSAVIDELLQTCFGVDLPKLLHPIADDKPCGDYLKYEDVYQQIKEYRRADDPSLPQGVWSHDLKRADWHKVSELALDSLLHRSKDIQLCIWVLEANIHLHGFAGIAPSCLLTAELCKHFWRDLHPPVENGDLEMRFNLFNWADEKLLPALRLVPLTLAGDEGPGYCWADWMKANAPTGNRERGKGEETSLSPAQFITAISLVPTDSLRSLTHMIYEGHAGVSYLESQLISSCGDEAPRLLGLKDFLEELGTFLQNLLAERGVRLQEEEVYEEERQAEDAHPYLSHHDMGSNAEESNGNEERGRRETYRQLEKAAHYLMRVDPHSPVPYLILQACRWGSMDTRELYRELFVECRGQLNIFELLGVDDKGMATEANPN